MQEAGKVGKAVRIRHKRPYSSTEERLGLAPIRLWTYCLLDHTRQSRARSTFHNGRFASGSSLHNRQAMDDFFHGQLENREWVAAFFERAAGHAHAVGRVEPAPDLAARRPAGEQIAVTVDDAGKRIGLLVE